MPCTTLEEDAAEEDAAGEEAKADGTADGVDAGWAVSTVPAEGW
ncbi:hypothetical protein ABT315_07535 [Streptomyces puniciscabiei]